MKISSNSPDLLHLRPRKYPVLFCICLLYTSILNIYPIFKTIYESFFKTGDFGKGNIFIGFDNYVKLFHEDVYKRQDGTEMDSP